MTPLRAFALATGLALGVAPARGGDPTTISFFQTTYDVQKFEYSTNVQFVDPRRPGAFIGPVECTGIHWLGANRLLLASASMDSIGSYQNFIIQIQLDLNEGSVSGFSYQRTVVINDPAAPPEGLGSPFSLDPSGVTVNTSATGLGANGDILVADNSGGFVRAYGFADGAYLVHPAQAFATSPLNTNFQDACFVPNGATGPELYTLDQTEPQIVRFDLIGAPLGAFNAGALLNPLIGAGNAKGMCFLPESVKWPASFQGLGGVLLVSFDQNGPALQVLDRDGIEVDWAPLANEGVPVFDPGTQGLQIEGVAGDPATGRLFLLQKGEGLDNNFIWVLSPRAGLRADLNCDQLINNFDIDPFVLAVTDPVAYSDAYPDCDLLNGDINGDGFINNFDIDPFVACLIGNCP